MCQTRLVAGTRVKEKPAFPAEKPSENVMKRAVGQSGKMTSTYVRRGLTSPKMNENILGFRLYNLLLLTSHGSEIDHCGYEFTGGGQIPGSL